MPVAGRGLVLRAAHDSQPIMRRTIHDTRLCHQSQSLTTDPHHAMGASDRYSTTQRRMPSSQVQSLRMMDVRFDACCASAERLVAVLAIDREVSLVLMHDVHACPGIAPLTSGLCCCKPMRAAAAPTASFTAAPVSIVCHVCQL